MSETSWPKRVAPLTDEQRRISDDWMRHFHEGLPNRFGRIERFNHSYAARSARGGRTLEVGAGLGEHLRHEDLSAQEYHAVELRPEMAAAIERDFPQVHVVVGDVQERLPYDDAMFDRAIAVHVFEHLPNLPATLSELERVLRPGGVLSVVIPCEGGIGYSLGRRLTTQRAFEQRYGTSYDWHIKADHVSVPREIIEAMQRRFRITDRTFFPLRVPSVDLNLVLGMTAERR